MGITEPIGGYPDPTIPLAFEPDPATPCHHTSTIAPVLASSAGCLECLRLGERDWVHLRTCLACGHVGCCDSSPGKHAAAHAEQQDHPIAASAEPGEQWAWCYLDQTEVTRAP
uniref:UBP-type zinc finger domain-containing protein n=1 Tax=Lolliginicoccus levis TaxID=2919542 RepID=UPI0035A21DE8